MTMYQMELRVDQKVGLVMFNGIEWLYTVEHVYDDGLRVRDEKDRRMLIPYSTIKYVRYI